MGYKKIIAIGIISMSILLLNYACKKYYDYNYQAVDKETTKFIFLATSQWIYKSDTGNLFDTVICMSLVKDTSIYEFKTYKGDNVRVLNEYYKMILKHSINGIIETHYFYVLYDRVNGQFMESKFNGQLYLDTYSHIDTGVRGGFERLMDTSITLNSISYFCIHTKIIAAEQTQHIYDYDTDLFFVKNIGLVKRFDAHSAWTLSSYHVVPVFY